MLHKEIARKSESFPFNHKFTSTYVPYWGDHKCGFKLPNSSISGFDDLYWKFDGAWSELFIRFESLYVEKWSSQVQGICWLCYVRFYVNLEEPFIFNIFKRDHRSSLIVFSIAFQALH